MSSFSSMLLIHSVGLDSETHFLPSWSWDGNSVGGGVDSRGTRGDNAEREVVAGRGSFRGRWSGTSSFGTQELKEVTEGPWRHPGEECSGRRHCEGCCRQHG